METPAPDAGKTWEELEELFNQPQYTNYKSLITLTNELHEPFIKAFVLHTINTELPFLDGQKYTSKAISGQILDKLIGVLRTYTPTSYVGNNDDTITDNIFEGNGNPDPVKNLKETIKTQGALINNLHKTLEEFQLDEHPQPSYIYVLPPVFEREKIMTTLKTANEKGRYWVYNPELSNDDQKEYRRRFTILLKYVIQRGSLLPENFLYDIYNFLLDFLLRGNNKTTKDIRRIIPYAEQKLEKIENNLKILRGKMV